jgi:hypothetical protein
MHDVGFMDYILYVLNIVDEKIGYQSLNWELFFDLYSSSL